MINKSLKPSLYKIITTKAWNQLTLVDNWLTTLQNLVRNGPPIESIKEITTSKAIDIKSDYKDILIRLKSLSGSPITMSANPQMIRGVDGQTVMLEGTDNTATVEIIDGNGFKLASGASFILAKYDILVARYNSSESLWLEVTRSKNT